MIGLSEDDQRRTTWQPAAELMLAPRRRGGNQAGGIGVVDAGEVARKITMDEDRPHTFEEVGAAQPPEDKARWQNSEVFTARAAPK
jgi:hypothetical protein